jgi:hypothetical protein
MFDYRGLQDVLLIALYWGVAFLAVLAAVYLLFRRRNVFMRERGPECMTIESPREPVRIGHPLHSSLRLRRWTAVLMLTMAASHVWWYAIGQWWLADDWLVRTITVIMLDRMTLVPLTMAVLLAMLQDRRRPLWPWLVMQLPVVIFAIVGIDERSSFCGCELPHYWQLAMAAVFITYYIYALWQYGRWLLDNYADLDHKEVWQSLVFALALLAVYVIYTSNAGELMREYLSQVISIVIIAFLLWRVETLQELPSQEDMKAF